MSEKVKRNLILCIVILVIYFIANSYTTQLFSVNKYNKYTDNVGKINDPKDIAKDFVKSMLDNNFDEAYKYLSDKSKTTFKSSNDLKKYFDENFSTVNRQPDGIMIIEDYTLTNQNGNQYNYILVSKKYSSPKEYDPMYSEAEFTLFSSITIYVTSPVDFTVDINM